MDSNNKGDFKILVAKISQKIREQITGDKPNFEIFCNCNETQTSKGMIVTKEEMEMEGPIPTEEIVAAKIALELVKEGCTGKDIEVEVRNID